MKTLRQSWLGTATALLLLGVVHPARATTYTVTNTNSSGLGSLAQAILDANALSGQVDTIAFNIPGSGTHVIDLSKTPLPEVADPVLIDGYTQPGAHPNTLSVGDDAVILVQLDGGSAASGNNGLSINAPSCVIRGLAITGFLAGPQTDNLLPPPGGAAIQLKRGGTESVVQGNFIGLKPDGLTPGANDIGVGVDAARSVVGGTDPAARNVISGNQQGIRIVYPAAVIVGNYIGTDSAGKQAVGNGSGVAVGATDVVVGGTSAGSGNLISGNRFAGIALGISLGFRQTGHADRALVQGNLLGTTADGVGTLGNAGAGVSVSVSSNSTVGGQEPGAGNVIAFNGAGVDVSGAGNAVLSNSIYSNTSRGIIFGSAQANNGQTSPVITSQTASGSGATTITGTLQSTPNTQFLLQFFSDSQSLVTPRQTYVGSKNVTTNGNGNATFSATFSVSEADPVFNATATNPNGDTSMFSRHPAILQNISARAAVGTGENALIAGALVQYGGVVARGIGPSLKPLGVRNALANPTLEFRDAFGAQMFDDDWQDDHFQASAIQESGLAPTDEMESAIVPFGFVSSPFRFRSVAGFAPYTAILRGKGDTTGIGVAEIYGFTSFNYGLFPKLGNISARAFVGTGDNVIIGGFILGDGNENPRVVIRAIGPSLKAAGVVNPLSDPMLELHNGDGATIAANDDWSGDALQTVGLAPTDARESAILTRLAPGAYTAIVRGKDNGTGVALVEVYRLP
ncbi:MAG: hypothetical protein ABR526_05590 [Chthoniobacterales bacterium]